MRFIPSLTTVFLILFFILTLLMNGDIKPFIRRGFFCDDSTINYPYKQETIDLKMLMLISLIMPGLIIKICDILLCRLIADLTYHGELGTNFARKRRKVSDNSENVFDIEAEEEQVMIKHPDNITRRQLVINEVVDDRNIKNTRLAFKQATLLNKAYGEFQFFFFGFSTTMLFTGLGKMTCGRFRPHFIQRCQPDIDCTSSANANKYIEEFSCSNNQLGSRGLSYIMTSWPSGK